MSLMSPSLYSAPIWAQCLKKIPKSRIKLGQLETPIQPWTLCEPHSKGTLFIKRDDLTGSLLSGNKVRKLEFLLADCLNKGAVNVMTCGSEQSNFCRAVACAAREMGLNSHLFLRSEKQELIPGDLNGNLLLDCLMNSKIHLVAKKSRYETDIKPKMEQLAQEIKSKSGEESYLIPVGGSDDVGLWGYIEAFKELMSQGVQTRFDDVVLACGSGGSVCGLAISNYLTGSKVKIHAVTVCDTAAYFHEHINSTIAAMGLGSVKSEDIVTIWDQYKGQGYGITTQEELEFICRTAQQTGVTLDPCYTGKAAFGLYDLIQPGGALHGRRVLFIHTGGIFGLYDMKITTALTLAKVCKDNVSSLS